MKVIDTPHPSEETTILLLSLLRKDDNKRNILQASKRQLVIVTIQKRCQYELSVLLPGWVTWKLM